MPGITDEVVGVLIEMRFHEKKELRLVVNSVRKFGAEGRKTR